MTRSTARSLTRSPRPAGAGLRIAGLYEAVLLYERDKYYRRGEPAVFDGRERRVSWVDRADHSAGFFVWPRRTLDLLEGGKSVMLSRAAVEAALWECDRTQSRRSVRLPFDRAVRLVRVSPDARVIPATNLDCDGAVVVGG